MIKNTNGILVELIKNQKRDISSDKKLSYNDLKRISKYLKKSIFDDECSIWSGYITVINNDDKHSYINFYFNRKKHALHRLLYINYIDNLEDNEYIKFKCNNKGKCCNISHFYKNNKNTDESPKTPSINPQSVDKNPSNIIVDFKL